MAIFTGTAGNDTIGPTTFNGVAANFSAADTLNGNNGDDTLNGGAGADIVNGGAGIDTIFAAVGDSVDGGTENDVVRLSGLPTRILGGAGTNDILRIDATGLNLSGLTAANFGGFERLLTPGFTPTLTAAQVNAFTVLGAAGFGAVSFNLAGAVAPIDLTGNLDPAVTSLVITGSAGAENITVPATFAGNVTFIGFSTAVGSGDDVFRSGNGNDLLSGLDGVDTLNGGGGVDTISGGAGADVVNGDAGNDTLSGDQVDGAADTLNGGAGNDTILAGTGDRIDGGTEDDIVRLAGTPATLAGGTGTDTLRLDATTLNLSALAYAGFERLVTGANADTLTAAQVNAFTTLGAAGFGVVALNLAGAAAPIDLTGNLDAAVTALTITGSAGTDSILVPATFLGSTTLRGGGGTDTLTGGGGIDTISGDAGADTINGGAGADILGGYGKDESDNAADTINGGAGADEIGAGTGDRVDGGTEDDLVIITGAPAVLNGGAGAGDHLQVFPTGADLTATALSGFERLSTNATTVFLTAAQLNAFATLGSSSDRGFIGTLTGAAAPIDLTGNLDAALTSLSIDGTSGADNITVPQTYLGTFQFNPFSFETGTGADTVRGGGGIDRLFGRDGADILSGGGGGDTMYGGTGADLLNGDAGDDLLIDTVGIGGGTEDNAADTLNGGAGNDAIFAGALDRIDGGTEDDTVGIRATPAVLLGGAGTDTLRVELVANLSSLSAAAFSGFERIVGDQVEITLTAAQLNAFTTVGGLGSATMDLFLTGPAAPIDLTGNLDPTLSDLFIAGTTGNDVITIGATFAQGVALVGGPNGVVVGTGNDTFTGGAGRDNFQGHDGTDTLNGGGGDDNLKGGTGIDVVNGGAGGDTIDGGIGDGLDDPFADTLNGEAGDDTIFGGTGDRIDAGADNDRVSVAGRPATLVGGTGTDTLELNLVPADRDLSALAFTGFERLVVNDSSFGAPIGLTAAQVNGFTTLGGSGFPTLAIGLAGTAVPIDLTGNLDPTLTDLTILGTFFDDVVTIAPTFTGATHLFGAASPTGGGNDTFRGGAGADEMFGDDGNDVLTGNAGADILNGGDNDDTIAGGAGNDVIDGGLDNDILDGGDNDDVLNGGGGLNRIAGGNGNDRIDLVVDGTWASGSTSSGDPAAGLPGIPFDLTGKIRHTDIMDGGLGIDTLFGTRFGDAVLLRSAAPVLGGNTAVDRVAGIEIFELGDGDDILNVNSATFTTNVTARGGAGSDQLWTGAGNDILEGGTGSDVLLSGRGNDTLRGGAAGALLDNAVDSFLFEHVGLAGFSTTERVEGFEDGIDQLFFYGFNFTNPTATQVGADTVLTISNVSTMTITLVGFNAANFSGADYTLIG